MPETKRPRGRPRPEESIRRDKAILKALEDIGPLSRNDLSERLNLSHSLVYLALERLRRQGLVRRCLLAGRSPVWIVSGSGPCE